jgi:tryptophan-rich sensory protein
MQIQETKKAGFVIGIIAPFLGFFLYYLMRFRLFTLSEFWQVLMMQRSLLSGIISISLLMNVLVFTICLNKKKDQLAIGIFIASCLYGAAALAIRWFF